jgi:phospholipid/cholesterol/gamma-HCH transport system substrate-binding protein
MLSSVQRRRRALGAVVLLAAVALAYLGIVKPNPFAYHEDVEAIFDHVQGIALVQRDVRVAGANVGTIGTVQRIGTHAEVELVLNQQIPIYRDATAALRPHTPFEGTAFIDLDPGTVGAGALGSAPIPLAQTSVFVSAGDVLSTFTRPVRDGFKTIVGQLSVGLDRTGQGGLRAALGNAPALLADTAAVAPALRGADLRQRDALQQLIPSLSSTVDALAGQGDELGTAAREAATTLDAVTTENAQPLAASIEALPATLAGAERAGTQAAATIATARRASNDLTPTLRAVPHATPQITALLRDAGPLLGGAAPPVNAFATALTNLGSGGPALGRLLATLHPIAGRLQTGLIPALDKRTKLGLPTYLQLIAATTGFTGVLDSFVSRAQVGSAFATGHDLRVTLQAPVTLPLGALSIPCVTIAKLSAQAVPLLKALGLCS